MCDMYDAPDRPDLKMGGDGDSRWMEIDFFWEAAGVAVLMTQPERHSAYTRAIDESRDELLRGMGIDVFRIHSHDAPYRLNTTMARAMELVHDPQRPRRRVYVPDGRSAPLLSPYEPMVNVSRTMEWLSGDGEAPADPDRAQQYAEWRRCTWNYTGGVVPTAGSSQ